MELADLESGMHSSDGHTKSIVTDRVKRHLILLLCRKFKIDEVVSEAYLTMSDWNPVQAIEQYSTSLNDSITLFDSKGQDDAWQTKTFGDF